MIDLSKAKPGQKVHYQPEHYGPDEWENGIIKEVPAFAFNPGSVVGYNCVRVVYHCGGNWDRYQDYTSALTNVCDLKPGWIMRRAKR
jgi:hypothetical protein